jgi:hypothetical protein
MRRLGLGLFLIASVSCVLLVWEFEGTEREIQDGLEHPGFVTGRYYNVMLRNVRGGMATLND